MGKEIIEAVEKTPQKIIPTTGMNLSEIIKARIIVAQKIPRNTKEIKENLIEIISDREVSGSAIYSLPRKRKGANGRFETFYIKGLSIHFVKELAREYGHLDYGVSVIEQGASYAKVMAYCYDLKANINEKREWKVLFTRKVAESKNPSEEIYKFIYSEGAKRMRSCIERVLPSHLQNFARKEIEKRLIAEEPKLMDNQEKETRFQTALKKFQYFESGIHEEFLLGAVGKDTAKDLTEKDFVELMGIYNSIKDGVVPVWEHFKELRPANLPDPDEAKGGFKAPENSEEFYKGLKPEKKDTKADTRTPHDFALDALEKHDKGKR